MQKKKQIKGKLVIVKKKPAGRSGGEVKKNNAVKKVVRESAPKNIKKKEAKKPVIKKPLTKKPVKKNIVAKPVKKAVPTGRQAAPKKEIKKAMPTLPTGRQAARQVAKKELPEKNIKVVIPVNKIAIKKAVPVPKKEVIKKVEKKEVKKETKKVIQSEIKQKINMNSVVEKIKYSDEDLIEFRGIIMKKLEEARRDLALLTEAYTTKNENDTNDTSPTFKVLEEGSNVLSKEENSQLAARQKKFIRDLENALIRIENKTYGICRVTGKLIPKERLRIVPHASMSIEAKLQQPQKR